MSKVVIKILQGRAVTLTMLGGLTTHPPVANFLQCRLYVPKIMKMAGSRQSYCKNYQAYFLAHPVCIHGAIVSATVGAIIDI